MNVTLVSESIHKKSFLSHGTIMLTQYVEGALVTVPAVIAIAVI